MKILILLSALALTACQGKAESTDPQEEELRLRQTNIMLEEDELEKTLKEFDLAPPPPPAEDTTST